MAQISRQSEAHSERLFIPAPAFHDVHHTIQNCTSGGRYWTHMGRLMLVTKVDLCQIRICTPWTVATIRTLLIILSDGATHAATEYDCQRQRAALEWTCTTDAASPLSPGGLRCRACSAIMLVSSALSTCHGIFAYHSSLLCTTTTKLHLVCYNCLLYTSPSPRDRTRSRMPSSA